MIIDYVRNYLKAKQFYFLIFLFALAIFSILSFKSSHSLVDTEPVHQIELLANQTNDDLTKAVSSAISSAKESVLLIVYTLSDSAIIKALKAKSQEGISVSVICDAKASPYLHSKLGNKVVSIRCFSPGRMHQKILVIDGKQTLIGSANMTKESLKMHGNLISIINDIDFALHIQAKSQSISVEGFKERIPHKIFNIQGQPLEMWFLPDDQKAINRLKELIATAKKTLRVAMFTWTRQDLAEAVIEAAQRGVAVKVVIDSYQGKGAGLKIVKLLKKNGIDTCLSPSGTLLHHKFLYIDRSILIHGSANWTKAAFTENDDCFIIMHDLTARQQNRMESLWSIIVSESTPVLNTVE